MTGDPNKELAEVVRAFRRSAGMSQLELAIAANVSRSHISDIENVKASPTVNALFQISQALEIPLSQVFAAVEDRMKAQSIRRR